MNLKIIAEDFIKNHNLLTIATCDKNSPWVANVFYYSDENLNLYFLSGNKSLHSQHIEKNDKVAISIYDHDSKWGEVKGVQMKGKVEELKLIEAIKVLANFKKIFKVKLKETDLKEVVGSRFYRFYPAEIHLRDSANFSGKKEVLLDK